MSTNIETNEEAEKKKRRKILFNPNYVQEATEDEEAEQDWYASDTRDFEEKFSAEMRKAYADRKRKDYDNTRHYFSTGKGRFFKFYDNDVFAKMISDGGNAAKTMYSLVDDVMSRTCERHRQKLLTAIKKIQKECPKALYTFLLILKNGKNRKESIWALVRYMKKFGTTLHVSTMAIWRALEGYFML